MRSAAIAGALLLWMARPAIAAPCSPEVLQSMAPGSALTRLQVLLAAGESFDEPPAQTAVADQAVTWPAIRDEAIAAVSACDLPTAYPSVPSLSWFVAFQAYATRTLDAVEQFTREHNVTTPILGTAVGLPSVPAPQPLEVGLSQVVAGGQPGFMVSLAATPGIRSEGYLARHLVVASSALVMAQPDASGRNEARFASGELAMSFTTQRTVYDWAAEVAEAQDVTDRAFDEHAWNAARILVIELRTRLGAGVVPRDAVAAAHTAAVTAFRDATRSYLEERFVRPELEAPQRGHWGAGLRLRASPEPDFVPEIPDEYAASVETWGDAHLVGTSSELSATGRASAAYSANPTSGADEDTILIDAAGGLSMLLRGPSGATRLSVLGLFRWAPRDVGDDTELSAGVTGLVQVPIGHDVALAGTVTWRARLGQRDETTTSLTLAKAL
jgi:hypothetical protein